MRYSVSFGFLVLASAFVLANGCAPSVQKPAGKGYPAVPVAARSAGVYEADLALVNATLIDGTGADPLVGATLLVKGDRIAAVGPGNALSAAPGTRTIDLAGATVLPGFINAHVHRGFEKDNLAAWATGGVTTVRDEGIFSEEALDGLMAFRDQINADPRYARLVSAGRMISVPGGYGSLFVSSPENARTQAAAELDAGVDMLKIALEDGYGGVTGLKTLTDEEIAAVVAVAHERGARVSAHITRYAFLDRMIAAGVDDVAHIPWDILPAPSLKRMADQGIYFVPTFTVFRNYNAPVYQCVFNLREFLDAGGRVALGNDYGGGSGDFELGIPMYEIETMAFAGMTPMEIIVAATLNAARVVGREKELGTLDAGKAADILVVDGDPLEDLQALTKIRMVIHGGVVIRG